MIPATPQNEELKSIQVLIEERRYEEAREKLAGFILLNPDRTEAFRLLAEVQGGLGRAGHREVALKRASQLEQIALNNKPTAAAERYAALLARKERPESVTELGGRFFGPFREVQPRRHVQREACSCCGRYLLRVYSPESGEAAAVEQERRVLGVLSAAPCQSAPELIEEETLPGGEPFAILRYPRADRGGFGLPDVLLALLEQQALGWFPGRLGLPYLRYDSLSGLCRFMDYALAEELDPAVRALPAEAYLDWCFDREAARCRREGERLFLVPRERSPDWIWEDGRLNLMATQAFRSQRLADVPEPSVQSLDLDRVVFAGARDWERQAAVLEGLAFAEEESVLDLGCGLGVGSQFLVRKGCAVTGVDVEERLLVASRLAANLAGLRIRYACLDLDFEELEGSFETVLVFATLHHFEYRDQVVERLNRICRRRLILECGLKESGFKWHGRWYWRHRGWDFASEAQLKKALADWFPAFRLTADAGATDHGRRVYVMERAEEA